MTNLFLNVDCMCPEVGLPSYPDNHFDLAVVDPPYGIGDKALTQGGTWANKHKKGDAEWDKAPSAAYFKEVFRVSRNQIIWGGNYFGLPRTRGFIVWDKKAHMPTMADCEYAWTSFDRNAKIVPHLRNTSEKRVHVCQKPIPLYRWQLKHYAQPNDLILDTHVGSASSLIACESMGFNYVGYELDPDYYAAAQNRMSKGIQMQLI